MAGDNFGTFLFYSRVRHPGLPFAVSVCQAARVHAEGSWPVLEVTGGRFTAVDGSDGRHQSNLRLSPPLAGRFGGLGDWSGSGLRRISTVLSCAQLPAVSSSVRQWGRVGVGVSFEKGNLQTRVFQRGLRAGHVTGGRQGR